MKKFIVIAGSLFLVACTDTSSVKIDGCDYIKTTSFTGEGAVESLTHKGNCSNPIHKPKIDTVYVCGH